MLGCSPSCWIREWREKQRMPAKSSLCSVVIAGNETTPPRRTGATIPSAWSCGSTARAAGGIRSTGRPGNRHGQSIDKTTNAASGPPGCGSGQPHHLPAGNGFRTQEGGLAQQRGNVPSYRNCDRPGCRRRYFPRGAGPIFRLFLCYCDFPEILAPLSSRPTASAGPFQPISGLCCYDYKRNI